MFFSKYNNHPDLYGLALPGVVWGGGLGVGGWVWMSVCLCECVYVCIHTQSHSILSVEYVCVVCVWPLLIFVIVASSVFRTEPHLAHAPFQFLTLLPPLPKCQDLQTHIIYVQKTPDVFLKNSSMLFGVQFCFPTAFHNRITLIYLFFVEGCLSFSQVSTIMNNISVNTFVHICLLSCILRE